MSYIKRALKGFMLVFVINVIAAFLGYFIRIVLARNLTVAEYGLFFSVSTLISFLGVFVGLGTGEALVRYIPEFLVKKKHDKIKNATIIALLVTFATLIILGVLLFAFSDFLAKHYFRNALAAPVLLLFIVLMFFLNFKNILRCFYQAFQNMKLYSLMYLAENLLLLVLLLCFFAFKKNIFSAAYAHIAAYLIVLFVFSFFVPRVFNFFKHRVSLEKSLLKKLFKFGIPVLASSIGGIIIIYTDTLVLTFFRSLEEVGIYNVVVPTAMILQFFATSVATVIFPMVAELWAKKRKDYLALGLKMLYQYSFVVIIPVALLFLSFSEIVLRLMFGEQYVVGAATMQILLIAIIFLGLHSITSTILSAIGKPIISTKILFQGALINLVLNLLLIPKLGMLGAALTSLIAYVYIAIRCIFKLKHFIQVEIPWINWLKTLFAGMLMLGLIFILKKILFLNPYLEAGACIFLGGLFYLALTFILRIVNAREIKDLARHITTKA
jgi:O-antigen/teichoic acid export membrane protein